jgi:hypothetical protein
LSEETPETPGDERDALRHEVESLRQRLKAADREVQRLAEQAADAERRAQFAQEVLTEERGQSQRERANMEKLIKALGGALEDLPARPEPPREPLTAVQNGAAAPDEAVEAVAKAPAAPPEPPQAAPDDALGVTKPGEPENIFPQEELEEGAIEATDRRSSLRRLLSRRRDPEPATPHKCSVCGRRTELTDEDEIRAAGWLVSAKVAVCDGCRADGWELEEEARLPFRRAPQKESGTRQ